MHQSFLYSSPVRSRACPVAVVRTLSSRRSLSRFDVSLFALMLLYFKREPMSFPPFRATQAYSPLACIRDKCMILLFFNNVFLKIIIIIRVVEFYARNVTVVSLLEFPKHDYQT